MLTQFLRRQLILFGVLTVIAIVALGWYYLRLPSVAGIGQYTLKADLPSSGGLYRTSNVTYRGITIGKVTDVQPTETGAQATMSIDSRYRYRSTRQPTCIRYRPLVSSIWTWCLPATRASTSRP